MYFSKKFISRTTRRSTFTEPVAAPLMRKNIALESIPDEATLTVTALGFYELWVNGEHATRGRLAPYITNPDQLLAYDHYDIRPMLRRGNNTLAFILGSGTQQSHTSSWGLSGVPFISAPKLAFAVELTDGSAKTLIEADETVRTWDSEILFNDLRYGEIVDARLVTDGWQRCDFDDSEWDPAISVNTHAGEAMLRTSDPVVETYRQAPVRIFREDDAYIYDFGTNGAGYCELCVSGGPGQRIEILYGELFENGKFSQSNLYSKPPSPEETPRQRTVYVLRGDREERYKPTFAYFGFRYARISGITAEQATPSLLTRIGLNSDLSDISRFNCSDESLNLLFDMTKRSTVSNFHHYPTDCPHREKNGWTADASLSAEHTLLNFTPEESYKMWMRAVCRAQNARGALPGVVPTGGYGFAWGNGPAWDAVLVTVPYALWQLRGDLSCARESAGSFMRYIYYLGTRRDKRGLLAIGLGDWCSPLKKNNDPYTSNPDPERDAPLVFTDSVYGMYIASIAAEMLTALGMTREAEYCRGFASEMRFAIREHLLDRDTMRFTHGDQTSQAMAIFYGLCDDEREEKLAYRLLLDAIEQYGGHVMTGVLGGRVIFRVLCEHGDADLAIKMITRPDPPSYGVMIADGSSTLTEHIEHEWCSSNHHFWGDIAAVMIEYFAGIRVDYRYTGAGISIKPVFPDLLDHASGEHREVKVSWTRHEGGITLYAECPEALASTVMLPEGYAFSSGKVTLPLRSGSYEIVKVK